MIAASWNAVSWETILNCYQKAGFFATPEPDNEDDDDLEVSPHILKDLKEKMNVRFAFEEYVDADDNLLPCAVQETGNLCIEDKNTETDDDDEETAACKPIPKCSEAMQCLDTYLHFLNAFLTCQIQLSEIFGNWKILLPICL
jgi:hypothetical protein